MKLRSIALGGLLGAGLLMAGCSALEELLKANVIYTVNGTGNDVTFTVTGDAAEVVADKNASMHLLTGSDSYDVAYTPNIVLTPATFAAGSVYMYAATTCSNAPMGYLQHERNSNKVNFANLSEVDIPGGTGLIVITQADGVTTHTVTEAIGLCAITGVPSLDGLVLENNMTVSLDGGTSTAYTVTGITPELAAVGSLKVDVVIFDDGSMTVVPMASYDDLVAIGVNSL